MKPQKKIHTLDQLEKNIYRLQLKAKNMEFRLSDNLDHLQKHYASMTMSSIVSHFSKKEEDEKCSGTMYSVIFLTMKH